MENELRLSRYALNSPLVRRARELAPRTLPKCNSGRTEVRGTGLAFRFEVPNKNSVAANSNSRLKHAATPSYPTNAASDAVLGIDAPISRVGFAINIAQIADSIVRSIPIDVINFTRRQLAVYIKPRKTVRLILPAAQTQADISATDAATNPAGALSRLTPSEPHKVSGRGIIRIRVLECINQCHATRRLRAV